MSHFRGSKLHFKLMSIVYLRTKKSQLVVLEIKKAKKKLDFFSKLPFLLFDNFAFIDFFSV